MVPLAGARGQGPGLTSGNCPSSVKQRHTLVRSTGDIVSVIGQAIRKAERHLICTIRLRLRHISWARCRCCACFEEVNMSNADYSRKLDELDRLLNDPDVPMQPDRIWSLLADVSRPDVASAVQSAGSAPLKQ
jgi:hypothetical protein